ncbi:MAG: hypothetical protein IPH22_02140 [Nitrosomonas sp.]|nr:hypothetical protein [Nitrosomonas sp.]
MTTKRGWLSKLKTLKTKPRELSPVECDELILLLGGTTRPNHRPEVRFLGGSLRRGNWTAIAGVVFSFLENAERLAQLEAEIQELCSPDFMEKYLAELPCRWSEAHTSEMTAENRDDAVRITEESVVVEIARRKDRVTELRQISAKNRAQAERMASEWFRKHGITLTAKQIQNELCAIQQAAKLKSLGLGEWRELMAIENARVARRNARTLEGIEKEGGSQPNK